MENLTLMSALTGTLVGSNLMGRIYNVRNGRIAISSDVSTIQLFDFSSETDSTDIGSLGNFTYSTDFIVDLTLQSEMNETLEEIYTSKDVNNSLSVNLGIAGEVGAFSGEMEYSYNQSESNHYESTMSLAKQYSMYNVYKLVMKGGNDYWRTIMKASVAADINGTMSATDLIIKYGTHFLASGYFGGIWSYSQSISTYTDTNSEEISNTLTASATKAGVEVSSSATNKTAYVDTQSQSTTNLGFYSIGGTTQESYTAWQASVNEGNWNLVSFDNVTDVSLQPISVLVDPSNQNRIKEINEAIKNYLAPYQLNALCWEKSGERKTINSGSIEKRFILNPETENTKVIIGLGFKVDNSNLTVLNAQLLDLRTGATGWYTENADGIHVAVYQSDTETTTSCDKGYVVTGLALNSGDKKMYPCKLYGQGIDVLNNYNNNQDFLNAKIESFGEQNDAEDTYLPTEGNSRIITGIEMGVYKGDIGSLYLTFGTFKQVQI
ncbi:hypothetical protein G6M26_34750 [Agrobacterium tumefaciens]|nr:hypothetical protein [Agrobacterium tumefaciens]NTE23714.1 hypothetical protein [Agrobacterium tumefaciens]